MSQSDTIICPYCQRELYRRSSVVCSNCFACTGCEIYRCSYCKREIVIKPKKNLLDK